MAIRHGIAVRLYAAAGAMGFPVRFVLPPYCLRDRRFTLPAPGRPEIPRRRTNAAGMRTIDRLRPADEKRPTAISRVSIPNRIVTSGPRQEGFHAP
jgi:hypothetical protein